MPVSSVTGDLNGANGANGTHLSATDNPARRHLLGRLRRRFDADDADDVEDDEYEPFTLPEPDAAFATRWDRPSASFVGPHPLEPPLLTEPTRRLPPTLEPRGPGSAHVRDQPAPGLEPVAGPEPKHGAKPVRVTARPRPRPVPAALAAPPAPIAPLAPIALPAALASPAAPALSAPSPGPTPPRPVPAASAGVRPRPVATVATAPALPAAFAPPVAFRPRPRPAPAVGDGRSRSAASQARSARGRHAKAPAGRSLLRVAIVVIVAGIAAVLLRAYVVEPYYIPSASMEPTLHGCPGCNDDRILVDKLSYRASEPNPGDIVVFDRPPGDSAAESVLVKRVIAADGDTVSLRGGLVYVNGLRVPEPYLNKNCGPRPSQPLNGRSTWLVPKGRVFVMGDNRCNSHDSRAFGPVADSAVVGRAFAIYWPLSRVGTL